MGVEVIGGECVPAMAAMPAESVHAIVTDPPYGLEFMGRDWDAPWKAGDAARGSPFTRPSKTAEELSATPYGRARSEYNGPSYDNRSAALAFQVWCYEWAVEALRVLKPGGYLLAFGGTRMAHRMISGVEDAGFEIRDTIGWLYGQGFPKAQDVGKLIDRNLGATREVVGTDTKARSSSGASALPTLDGETEYHTWDLTKPATPEAEQWDGWHTALKPAHEPIVVARKPMQGGYALNHMAHGVGALNVRAGRVNHGAPPPSTIQGRQRLDEDGKTLVYGDFVGGAEFSPDPDGRWPANVALDEDAAAWLDERTGGLVSGGTNGRRPPRGEGAVYNPFGDHDGPAYSRETGGASRFFYVAKASTFDRRPYNQHPTVKPVELMRWLIRLVTPPGGRVLDPFAGSGSTGVAAVIEGADIALIEREPCGNCKGGCPDYRGIIERRLAEPIQPVLL